MADKDYAFGNTLEDYYVMIEDCVAGKDYSVIDSYFACIRNPLASVSAVSSGGKPVLHDEGAISAYSEPLIMWFDDKPLVITCYTDFIANPVYVDDKKYNLADISSVFSSLIGAALQDLQYIGATICCLSFSNGKSLLSAGRDIGDRKRIGTFEIRDDISSVPVEQMHIKYFCGMNGHSFADTATKYEEDAIALFCSDGTYLLYPHPTKSERYQLCLCPCSKELLTDYTRQYPLTSPEKTIWMYEENRLSAVRLDFPEGHLYMLTNDHNVIEIQLSDELYDSLDYYVPPFGYGKHMDFMESNDGDLHCKWPEKGKTV